MLGSDYFCSRDRTFRGLWCPSIVDARSIYRLGLLLIVIADLEIILIRAVLGTNALLQRLLNELPTLLLRDGWRVYGVLVLKTSYKLLAVCCEYPIFIPSSYIDPTKRGVSGLRKLSLVL